MTTLRTLRISQEGDPEIAEMRRCRDAAALAPEEAALAEERYEFADMGMREVRHAPMVAPPALTLAQPLPWPQPSSRPEP